MKLEQAARQALEALESYSKSDYIKKQHPKRRANGEKAITALREALAERHKESCACEVCRGCDNADIKADQAEQEPEVWYCPDCGTLSETQVKCCPDWIRSRKVPKNFALTCKATFDRNVQAEQEPVAWFVQYKNRHEFVFGSKPEFIVDGVVEPLYAAPVRTKDLTDDEIEQLENECEVGWNKVFARAVIAADREKNHV